MRVFDFDNTIYDGESSFDFFCFCMRKRKRLVLFVPVVIYNFVLYKFNLLSEDKIYKFVNSFSDLVVKNKNYSTLFINEFWQRNECKLKSDFLNMLNHEDVIITGAPNFLISGISEKLGTKNICCSIYDIDSGLLKFLCFGENKVKVFKEKYPNVQIDEFYTDSMSDKPMMDISRKVYMVRK